MSLDSLVLDLAARLELPELALNDDRVCQIVADDDLAVTIEGEADTLVAERIAAFYKRYLAANQLTIENGVEW
ncbi:MAG: hypothetical protein ACKV19_15415, partial [Verrucomicrobiales bacterium]